MKTKQIEAILSDDHLDPEWVRQKAKEIAALYSAGEEVNDGTISAQAAIVANQGEFKSNFPHDWSSVFEGFKDGAKWMRSKLTRPTDSAGEEVSEEEMRDILVEFSGDNNMILSEDFPELAKIIKEKL